MSETERSARRGTGSRASAAADVDRDVPAVGRDVDRPGEEQRDDPRQQPMLDGLDPLVERRLVVAGQDRDRLLGDDRAAVERLVDEVDGRAGDRDAGGERVADRVGARERRQERSGGC